MLIWGFVFAGIAFGVLVAFLWLADRELKEKNQRLQAMELELAGYSGGNSASSENALTDEGEKITELEKQVAELTGERSRLMGQVQAQAKEKEPSREAVQNGQEAEAKIQALERQVAKVEEQNLELRTQIGNLIREQSGREEKFHRLEHEHARVAELERQITGLRQERDRLLGQVESLESEKKIDRARIETLEAVEGRMPDLERQITDLGRENSKLAAQIADLRSLLLQKLRVQVEGLQDLYQKVEAGEG